MEMLTFVKVMSSFLYHDYFSYCVISAKAKANFCFEIISRVLHIGCI